MSKKLPTVVVVTGSPGSGKTTLAHKLSKEMGCPAICRDEIKEGYVLTQNKSHDELSKDVNTKISAIFFDLMNIYLRSGVTIVIEAAFQHNVWAPRLNEIKDIAKLKLLICDVDPLLAFERRQRRLLANPSRAKFHGEKLAVVSNNPNVLQSYEPPSLDMPTLRVNTTNEYDPKLETLLHFVLDDDRQ